MMYELLLSLPLAINLAFFALLASGIWYSGFHLTLLADELSDRLNLAKSTVGLVFLALATSLPEVATTLTGAIADDADLVLNNLFGGIALQTAILAFADFWARGAITNYPRKADHALEAILLIALLAIVQAAFVLHEPVTFLNVGLGSVVIGLAYMATLLLLRHYGENNDWVPVDLPSKSDVSPMKATRASLSKASTQRLGLLGILACCAILILGTALVVSAEVLSTKTGLGSSFIGVTLVALATSLPELSTTVTAVRMGAYTMAISNIFGSNLIMLVLVLPADALYRKGPILREDSASAQLAIALGMLLTTIYLVGLIIRRKPRIGYLGIDSAVVLVAYLAGLFLFYIVK
tara:strand:- start:55445 stop:56497 length:1053 start_codon:yes stop_codon:yes gene_type:complete